nr:hypothetical protein [Tanacetum cinerariifolium]
MITPIDFSAFAMNRLRLTTLTREVLVGLVFNLLKGYDRPDIGKPLPLIEKEGRLTIPVKVLFNNDLEYLKGDKAERTYCSSITNMPAAKYTMEVFEIGSDDVDQTFEKKAVDFEKPSPDANTEQPSPDVAAIRKRQKNDWYKKSPSPEPYDPDKNTVKKIDDAPEQPWFKEKKHYTFKEGSFPDLNLSGIEDMLLLIAQQKINNLDGDVIVDFFTALKMLTRCFIVQNRDEDVQLGVESY